MYVRYEIKNKNESKFESCIQSIDPLKSPTNLSSITLDVLSTKNGVEWSSFVLKLEENRWKKIWVKTQKISSLTKLKPESRLP